MEQGFFYLDIRKTVQAIGVLLDVRGIERLEYIAIIKLLYIADRESWKETGASITGDVPCAMKNGPVLRGVYDPVNPCEPSRGAWPGNLDSVHPQGRLRPSPKSSAWYRPFVRL
jgi:hypothetical protein